MSFYALLRLGERSRLMSVSSPYHVRFASYKNFNESQVNACILQLPAVSPPPVDPLFDVLSVCCVVCLISVAEIPATVYWRHPFPPLCDHRGLTEFLVLQCETVTRLPACPHTSNKVKCVRCVVVCGSGVGCYAAFQLAQFQAYSHYLSQPIPLFTCCYKYIYICIYTRTNTPYFGGFFVVKIFS